MLKTDSFIFLIISLCLGVMGQIFFKLSSQKIESFNIASILFNLEFIIAIVFYGLASITWVFALKKLELSYAYPFLSIGYVIVFLLGVILFKEGFTLNKLIGIVLISIGVILLSTKF